LPTAPLNIWPIYLQQPNYFQKIVVIIYNHVANLRHFPFGPFAPLFELLLPYYFPVVCLPSNKQNTLQTHTIQPHNLHSKLGF